MNQYTLAILTASVSIVAVIISYFNYRLSKTLNIKNQIFNEKLKKYIDLSRKIAEFIELLDVLGPTVNRFHSKTVEAQVLNELVEKTVIIGLSIQYLIIESHMLVPEYIIKKMVDFAEYQNLGLPHDSTKIKIETYWEQDRLIREKSEALIMAFREDLGVEKLSIRFTNSKIRQEKLMKAN